MSLPLVAIVGRPNVGKSSLFNRFVGRRIAVVDPTSGVTRDRNYATCDWNGREFRLVDTGGMVPNTRNLMEKEIFDQSEFAVNEADLIVLVVDIQTGLDQADQQLATRVHQSGKPCVLLANKADNETMAMETYPFARLGLGDPYPVSATSGFGTGDFLDALVAKLPDAESDPPDPDLIKVALVGRPNVGKSSFINNLLGENRHIVSTEAGTTRDSTDTPFELDGHKYLLVDTAGLRRSYKVRESLEFYTNLRTIRAMEQADVAVVLIDASEGITMQDAKVLDQVAETRRAAVLCVNKWDLIEKDTHTVDEWVRKIHNRFPVLTYLPVIFVSALTGQRIRKVLDLVREVHAENLKRVDTNDLNKFLERTLAKRKPPAKDGKFIQFKYVTQSEVAPPTFIFFVNRPEMVDKTYLRFISNQLRDTYGFEGVPIRIKCRRK